VFDARTVILKSFGLPQLYGIQHIVVRAVLLVVPAPAITHYIAPSISQVSFIMRLRAGMSENNKTVCSRT